QHHAVSVAPVSIGEVPAPLLVEAYERIDPAGPIEVRPLIAHAQMHLDHATVDGLGFEDAGVALEMLADPRAAIRLDAGIVRAVRSGIETLAQRDRDLVVDPAMIRVPKPGVAVFGRNVHIRRTGGAFEVLQAPRIGFADRHRGSIRLEHCVYSPDPPGCAKAR